MERKDRMRFRAQKMLQLAQSAGKIRRAIHLGADPNHPYPDESGTVRTKLGHVLMDFYSSYSVESCDSLVEYYPNPERINDPYISLATALIEGGATIPPSDMLPYDVCRFVLDSAMAQVRDRVERRRQELCQLQQRIDSYFTLDRYQSNLGEALLSRAERHWMKSMQQQQIVVLVMSMAQIPLWDHHIDRTICQYLAPE